MRAVRGAKLVSDVVDKFCIAKIRSLLTSEGQQHLDSWRINTKKDLRSALHSWETTRGYIVREERSLWNPQFGQHRRLVCYKCQKPSHRATDCRSTQSSSSDLHKSDGFVLHAIHVVLSPDCPSKTSNGSKRVEVKKEPENADKLKKKSFKQAEVSVLYN